LNIEHPTTYEFLHYVLDECLKNGVSFSAEYASSITDEKTGLSMKGYFESYFRTKKMAFSIKDKEEIWLSTLVHEFSHLQQNLTNSPKHRLCNAFKYKDCVASYIMDCHLTGDKKFPKYIIKKAVRLTRDMELECEGIAVGFIKKFSLPINIESYIKSANAYIIRHNFFLEFWYMANMDKSTESFKKIVDLMPNTMLEYKEIDKFYEEIKPKLSSWVNAKYKERFKEIVNGNKV
jgi:hypothetical protein